MLLGEDDEDEGDALDGAAETNAPCGTGGAVDAETGTIGVGGAEGAETGTMADDRLACPLALLADGADVGVGGGADAVV